MPFPITSRTSLAIATAIIVLTGIGAGIWRYHEAGTTLLRSFEVKVLRSSVAFDPVRVARLSGTTDPAPDSDYARVKARLIRLKHVEPTVRSVYLLRRLPGTQTFIYLADAETEGSASLVRPGDERPAAQDSAALRQLLLNGQTQAEGPLRGQSGPRIVGYALIGEPSSDQPTEVLGVEFSAEDWEKTLWTAALGTAGYVWLFLILPLVALVSTRKQAQQRDALRNLTEAMDQGHSAVLIVDTNQRIEYANTGFCRQLGYSRRDLIGRPLREFQGTETQPEVAAEILTSMRAGRNWTGEWFMRRQDGALLPVRGSITPVKDRNQTIRSFVAVFEDISEVRRTERLLREAKERAEAGDRAKGQFLATMSHEVRTPLNGIVGFASLLLDTELTPEQQEYVETIRTSSETLIQLTGDILDYARIESGRLKLEPQPCDPRECIENALDLVAAASVQKNIELLHWVEDGVPAAIVADVGRLRQVIVNLVNNAVKFTADGEVEVRARLVRIEAPMVELTTSSAPPVSVTRCVLEFSVRDTGIGIAPEHHHKIFRPFSQVDDSTTRRFGGTGLGLAICKNIVELMDGSISFASEPNRGSTFTFSIRVPVHTAAASPVPRPLHERSVAISTRHPALRDELAHLVERLGGRALTASVAELVQRADWDLALLDLSGAEAMEIASQREPRPGLPPEKLVAIVPMVLPGELRSALRTHFRLVLNKPLHHDMLGSLLGAPPLPVPPAPAASGPAPSGEAEGLSPLSLRVLIVEDNAVNQRLIQKVVAKLGCEWAVAPNGRVALEELSRHVPDVVLMDLHMPELDGLTATTKIRAGAAGAAAKDVWIIALTADAREEQRERTLAAGADDYLTKPVQLDHVREALLRFLRRRRG